VTQLFPISAQPLHQWAVTCSLTIRNLIGNRAAGPLQPITMRSYLAASKNPKAATQLYYQTPGEGRLSSSTLVANSPSTSSETSCDCSWKMDPLGAAANIIQIISAANKVISLCKRFLEVVRDAPGDLRLILIEVSTLRAVLDDLHFLVSCNHIPSTLDALTRHHGPLEGCRKVIAELEDILPPEAMLATESKRKAILTALSWLMKESRAKTLLDELAQYKSTISLALTTDSSLDIKDTKANTERIYAVLTDIQQQHVYNWLHATDPSDLHEKSCKTYEPGTGEWLFRSPVWQSWLEEKTRCLWVHGIPGAGKTIFASHLIETIKWHPQLRSPSYALAYYYCYFGHGQDETVPFLRWTLLELCRKLGRVPTVVYELYRHGGNPTARSLLQTLEEVVQAFDKVFIIVDALDESLDRENLLQILQNLATDARFDNLRVLVTSREYIDIEEVMLEVATPISMRNHLLNHDIALYVRSKLDGDPKLRRWPPHFRDQVFEALTEKANGMFRWVVCQIEAIHRLKPETRIINTALANLPKTLDETYERVFLNIPEEAQLFVQHVLHWMSTHLTIHKGIPDAQPVASVNLSPVDIPCGEDIPCDVLFGAVERSLAEDDSCDPMFLDGYVLDEELLREYCGCLVTLTSNTIRDRSAIGKNTVVSFAHYTVLEFLESSRIRRGPAALFALDREQVLVEHTKMLLLGATATSDRWSEDWPQLRGPDYYSDFERYCAHSAVLFLHWHARMANSWKELSWVTPVAQLLEASAPPSLGSYFWFTQEILVGLENPISPSINAFRQAHKLRALSPPSEPHLETLARMFQMDETGYLARSLLASLGRPSSDLACQLDLEFQPGAFFENRGTRNVETPEQLQEHKARYYQIYRFRGSVFEFYAQLPTVAWTHQGLYEILDFAAGHFDPSTILLYVTAKHQHVDDGSGPTCWGCLTLTKLLRLGARATAPGYAVGSLQVAVARSDIVAVKLFLEAGMDPNDTGDACGEIGSAERGPLFEWARSIRGRSPLNIAKERRTVSMENLNLWYRKAKHTTSTEKSRTAAAAAVLIQYGARDFTSSPDEKLSLATGMGMLSMSGNEGIGLPLSGAITISS
jgi:hypothetical protein